MKKEDFFAEALLIGFFPIIVTFTFASVIHFDIVTFEMLTSISGVVSITGLVAHMIYMFVED